MRTRPIRRLAIALALAASACARHPQPTASPAPGWLGTWAASQQLTEPRNMPPAPLAHSTLRQVIHVSLGGPRIRVVLSNLFGDGPVAIGAARIARAAGGSAIEPASERRLTFGGADSLTIPAGQSITSDPLDFQVSPLSNLAVTLRIGDAPGALTGHPGSRTTSYIKAGDWVSAPDLADAATTEHWYFLANLDVASDSAAALVALGNSITDGHGAGTNRDDRWPDNLARRLQADPRTREVAVLNAGIGGNCILRNCLGPAALSRFERDVVEPSGVRWVIVLEGVNDIGGTRSPAAADSVATGLIAAYQRMVAAAHARGLKIYGATILPFGGSFYDRPGHEEARQKVNAWIRTGAFDAVIDFDAAVRDPSQPHRMLPRADSGDHLHPGEEGYRMMADAIDLGLFAQ